MISSAAFALAAMDVTRQATPYAPPAGTSRQRSRRRRRLGLLAAPRVARIPRASRPATVGGSLR